MWRSPSPLPRCPLRLSAQDSYYREVTVDGRIYVFSSETAQKTWEASKELAVGTITRPGYGPNGETVVFDGPAAVEAFNKKYGKTDAPPTDVKAVEYKLPFDVKYRMPGLRLTFPKFELNWVNRMQLRFTYDDPDSALAAVQPEFLPHPPPPVQVGRLDLYAQPDL